MWDFLSEINKFGNSLMIGVSILAQFIIYPSFKKTDFKSFNSYHLNYTKKMFYIAAPIMLVELFSSILLVYKYLYKIYLTSLFILILIWILTFVFIVPIHNFLSKMHNKEKIDKMIKLNGLRTILWIFKYSIISF
jgi:hypothetical protein